MQGAGEYESAPGVTFLAGTVIVLYPAGAASSVRIGPMVTPLSRRRVHKVARETATLDLLSRGRLTLGVGLGASSHGELEPFGEVTDPGAGTLPALRELLPRRELVRGSVVSAAEFGVLALARWLALRRTGPDAG